MTSCGAEAWGNPRRDGRSPALLAVCFPPPSYSCGPGAGKVRSSSCRAAGETGYSCRLLPSRSRGAAGADYTSSPRLAALSEPRWGAPAPGTPQAACPQLEPRSGSERPGRGRQRCGDPLPLSTPYPARPGLHTGNAGDCEAFPFSFSSSSATRAGWLWRPRKGPPSPQQQQSSRAHRRPRRAAGRAATTAAGIRGHRAGSSVPSPAGGAAATGARARRGGCGGSSGSDPARARARTPPSLPWPRAALPPPAAGGRQSAPLPRRLARRGSGWGRCSGCAEREVPPGGYWRSVRASPSLVIHWTDGDPQFSLCPAGRSGAGPPRDPSLAKRVCASEP